ncbi:MULTISPECIES: ribosome assembly RNA-binding protein YhbY [unclassified Gemella]|uniref:ribosome assembly RNA-binding protein YhbY n=1 Tax=unclassified Gemella TaxID=2624949 RepID=UPI00107476E2|nr:MULTISPECIES: ribosome assembly RNA-binding protein YhbY [unclassified Gemella]MBF0710722.1 ribosome assembly RNA-binding protein YhbY [Gemella sp. GL1.1]MBF0746709.1 ribosome assembly RNA-binding protein YhbY [Gemella sp. 19428wG2_WT2a]NYS28066.1 ribosome assembly RNA-binding protein YhbY [Gemella sp. GL1]TFU60058.1 ribosome assembly RNA-binding protein YhbY [Gemella sp. WT2a]
MLRGKQKRQLRALAHHLNPIFQIGKSGITPEMVKGISDALEKRELIKISILQNCDEDKNEVAETISSRTRSEIVQVIGKAIVLYKQSSQEKYRKIELVR